MLEDVRDEFNIKALSKIQLCLGDEVFWDVTDEVSTVGLWLKLESLHMTKSLTNMLYLNQYLYTLRMRESMSLKAHVDEFNKTIMYLKNINIKIDTRYQVIIVLWSLSTSYDHFVMILFYGKYTISLKDVKASLHSRELKNIFGEEGEWQVEGLFPRGGTKKNIFRSDIDKKKGGASVITFIS